MAHPRTPAYYQDIDTGTGTNRGLGGLAACDADPQPAAGGEPDGGDVYVTPGV